MILILKKIYFYYFIVEADSFWRVNTEGFCHWSIMEEIQQFFLHDNKSRNKQNNHGKQIAIRNLSEKMTMLKILRKKNLHSIRSKNCSAAVTAPVIRVNFWHYYVFTARWMAALSRWPFLLHNFHSPAIHLQNPRPALKVEGPQGSVRLWGYTYQTGDDVLTPLFLHTGVKQRCKSHSLPSQESAYESQCGGGSDKCLIKE